MDLTIGLSIVRSSNSRIKGN